MENAGRSINDTASGEARHAEPHAALLEALLCTVAGEPSGREMLCVSISTLYVHEEMRYAMRLFWSEQRREASDMTSMLTTKTRKSHTEIEGREE